MRLALIGSVIVLGVAVVGYHAARHTGPRRPCPPPVAQVVHFDNACPAGAADRRLPLPPVAQAVHFEHHPKDQTWTVSGWGKTEADAEQVALDKACKEVNDFLQRQDPPVHWRPSRDFVDHNLVKERKPEAKELPDLGQMYQATFEVRLEPKDYRDILEHDRQDRADQRHVLLGKVVLAILALLLAVFGYFRLEEMTRGYYTLWLRLGALALVGVAGALLLIVA